MNQAAAAANNASTGVSIGSYATLTTMHLALVALLAVAVLVAVVHGIRLKHRRVAAEQAVVEHAAEAAGARVFQAGTRMGKSGLVVAGGRVLAVTATGSDTAAAQARAYAALDRLSVEGGFHRRDIGWRDVARGAGAI